MIFTDTLDRLKPFTSFAQPEDSHPHVAGGQEVTEITLSEIEDDYDPSRPVKIHAEYMQENKFKGVRRSFVIFNNVQLHHRLVSYRRRNEPEHRINLSFVNPQPQRVLTIAWNWLSTAFASIVWSMVLLYVGFFMNFSADIMMAAGILLGTCSLISMMMFYYNTQDQLLYTSETGGVPLFDLVNYKPGDQLFERFQAQLRKHIELGQSRLTPRERLVGELKELRRIRDEGLISNELYEQARGRIFKHEAYQAVGE